MLGKFVGQPITIVTADGPIAGTLVAFDGTQLVVKTDDPKAPIQIVMRGDNIRDVKLGALPGGLAVAPSLEVGVVGKTAGDHTAALTYVTRGLTWSASYSLILDDDKHADLDGWLTINNASGGRFADATIRLVAGDVFRPTPPAAQQEAEDEEGEARPQVAVMPPAPFRVTLDRPATLAPGDAHQLELVALNGQQGKHTLVFEHIPRSTAAIPAVEGTADPGNGEQIANQLDSYLELPGAKQALPPGPLRVFKRTPDGLELTSEDTIAATVANDPIRLHLGTVTDVSAHRHQTDFAYDETAKEIREKIAIDFVNKQKEPVEVTVVEHMWRAPSWTLEQPTLQPVSKAGPLATFVVKVPPGATKTLEYTVLYTW